MNCTEPDCLRPVVARGLCASHYQSKRAKAARAEARAAPRICRHCGLEFSGRQRGAVYCSPECKNAFQVAADSERRRQARAGRVCRHCGTPFDSPSARAKCCSRECSVAYQNAVRAAAQLERRLASLSPCLWCGGTIELGERKRATKYCSKACKHLAHGALYRARYGPRTRDRKYEMEPGQYDAMLASQGERCAVCRTDDWGGRHGVPHVDHEHTSGRVRGLLCDNCNNGLGRFRDDPARLRAAADYLERT